MVFSYNNIYELYEDNLKNIDKNDFSLLKDLHCISAGGKGNNLFLLKFYYLKNSLIYY
jgi:hypothetical protein